MWYATKLLTQTSSTPQSSLSFKLPVGDGKHLLQRYSGGRGVTNTLFQNLRDLFRVFRGNVPFLVSTGFVQDCSTTYRGGKEGGGGGVGWKGCSFVNCGF